MKKLYFTRSNGRVDEDIRNLIETVGVAHHPYLVHEMIIAALKSGQEIESKADMKLMSITMKEMRFTAKVFGPYSNVKKVTVFGSARTGSDEPVYEMARLFGERLARSGYMVITGAGAGIMQAINEGAGPDHSFGVNIQLPFEQAPNPVLLGNPRLITYKYFFNRKVAFVKEADAIAFFPGGFGTLDEAMEIITLLQTGKRNPLPLIFIDEPGGTFWARWLRFFKEELLPQGYITDDDFNLFERVDSAEGAIEKINLFYRRYHSMRYVNQKLVIRLSSPLDPQAVEKLSGRFYDILLPGGKIYLSGPLHEEADEPEIADLQRIILNFNFKDYGKLMGLINEINSY